MNWGLSPDTPYQQRTYNIIVTGYAKIWYPEKQEYQDEEIVLTLQAVPFAEFLVESGDSVEQRPDWQESIKVLFINMFDAMVEARTQSHFITQLYTLAITKFTRVT